MFHCPLLLLLLCRPLRHCFVLPWAPNPAQIGEGQVIGLLEQVNKELDKKQAVKVTMKRKAYMDEDDDDGILDEEF